MSEYIQVSTATPTEEGAVALAGSAVKARLAAGAQVIGPVTSVLWHLGEYGTGQEYKVLLTTTTDRYAELEAHRGTPCRTPGRRNVENRGGATCTSASWWPRPALPCAGSAPPQSSVVSPPGAAWATDTSDSRKHILR